MSFCCSADAADFLSILYFFISKICSIFSITKPFKPMKLHSSHRAFLILAGSATAFIFTHSARAANAAWSTTPGSMYFTGNNWTTGATTPGAPTGTIASGDGLYFGTSSLTTLYNNETVGFAVGGGGTPGFVFNSGAAAFIINGNSLVLNGDITNSSTNLQTINTPLTSGFARNFTTSAGGGDLTFGGSLTATGGAIAKAGAGTLTLGGPTNTSNQAFNVNAGTLDIGAYGITLSNGTLLQTTGSGTVNATGGGTIKLNVAFGDLGVSSGSGTLTINAVIANGSTNGIDLYGGSATGTVVLGGANTQTGNSNLQQGNLRLANSLALQNSTLNFNGFAASGTSLTFDSSVASNTFLLGGLTANVSGGASRDFALQNTAAAPISLIVGNNNSAQTYGGIMSGAGSLTKVGTNTQTLTGANAYTGGTVVTLGFLTLDFNAATIASNILYNGVTAAGLTLGGASSGMNGVPGQGFPGVATQAKANTATVQTFGGLTLNPSMDILTARGIGTGNMTVTLGAITHNPGGSINFSRLNDVVVSTGAGIFATTTTNGASGILGAWAVTNPATSQTTNFVNPTDYAAVSGGNIVAYTGYNVVTGGSTLASVAANNNRVTASGTIALAAAGVVTTDLNTLSLASTATGATTVTIGASGTLRLGANGGMFDSSGGGNITVSGGTLTAGGTPDTAGEINLIGGGPSNPFTLNSVIANNGTGAVALSITSYGNGNITIGGTNTYTGGTFLNSGRTQANSSAAFGTGAVTIMPYAQAYLNSSTFANDFNISGNGTGNTDTPSAIRFQGPNTITGKVTLLSDAVIGIRGGTGNFITGKITGNYNLTIGEGTGFGDITISNTANDFGGRLNINNEAVILGASGVIPDASTVNFSNAASKLILNGFNETIGGILNTGGNTSALFEASESGSSKVSVLTDNQTFSSTFNGILRNSASGSGNLLSLVKTGAGTLTLTNAANLSGYTGGTTINGGAIQLGVSSGATFSAIGSTTGALTVNTGGTLDMNGFNQTVGPLTGTGGLITSSAVGTLTLTTGDVTNTTFAGAIRDGNATSISLVKQGAGTLTLTGINTYSGTTTVNVGALQIGTGGSIVPAAAVTLSGTGTLIVGDATGPVAQTFNNLTSVSGSSIVGGAATASTLTLNGAGTVTYPASFGGAGTNQNNLNLIIAGTASPVSILGGTSTYTGTTTINSGSNLALTGKLGTTATTINSGGTFSGFGNGTTTGVIGGNLTGSGGATISLTNTSGSLTAGNIALGNGSAYGAGNYSTLTFTLAAGNLVESLNTPGTLNINSGGAFVNVTNPAQNGTFVLANYTGGLTGSGGFSLSSTTPNVLTQNSGRNVETLTVGSNTLTLVISGAGAPGVAYFNGGATVGSRTIWNNLSDPSFVNFSTDLAGLNDGGNTVGALSDVILNANNATTNVGSASITETLGASTIINSLRVNGNGTTTIGADGSILTINALGDANTDTGGGFTGNPAGVGIVIASSANAFTVNVPVELGNDQSWTNNSGNLFTKSGTVSGKALVASTLALSNSNSGGTTLPGIIGNGAGGTLALAVNNTGSGVTTLGATNSYSGGTTLNGGTLTATVSGGFGLGNVTVNPTNTTASAADDSTLNTNGSIASTAALTVNSETGDGGFGIGTVNFNGATPVIGSLSGNGFVVLDNAGGTAFTVGSTNNLSSTFSGVISNGLGTGTLIKAGTGTLLLSGTNTFTGGTILNAGILQIGNAGAFGTTSRALAFGVNSTGKLQLNGTSLSLTDLTTNATVGTPIIESGSASAGTDTLTVTTASTDAYAGVLQNGGTRLLGLTKSGTGTLTLSGTNTFSGNIAVTGGTLAVGNVATIGANVSTTSVNITSPGILAITSTANQTYADTFTGNGKILCTLNTGGSDTIFTNFNAFTGTLELSGPGGNSNKLQITGNITSNLSTAQLQVNNNAQYFTGTGTVNFGNISIIGNGNNENRGAIRLNTGTLGGNISLAGNSTIGSEGGVLTGNISSGIAGNNTLTMGTGNSTGTALLSGNVSNGTGTLAITQANGTTTLSGANSYSGATTINFGVFKAGSTGAFSPASAVTLANTNGATLNTTGFNTTIGSLAGGGATGGNVVLGAATLTTGAIGSTTSYAGVISGSGGGLTKTGAGTQTLSAINTYTGATTVNAGILKLGAAGSIAASSGVSLATGAVLDTTAQSFSMAGGQPFTIHLDGTGAGSSGKILAAGLNISSGVVNLTIDNPLNDSAYVIADYTGTVTTTFGTITGIPTGYTINYAYNSGTQIAIVQSGYDSWALSYGLTGADALPSADPDNDGIKNLLEYVLSGNPTVSSQSILPTQDSSGANLVFTFTRSDASETDTTQIFQYGTDLTGWTNVSIGAASTGPDGNGVTVDIVENLLAPDTVTVTVPKGAHTVLFGRLDVTK